MLASAGSYKQSAAWIAAGALGILLFGCSSARAENETRTKGQVVAAKLLTASSATPACPKEMAQVGSVCVDRWEAHLVRRSDTGALLQQPYFERPLPSVRYEAISEPGVKPQGYISRTESLAACSNAGKRLCSVSEWYRACSGSSHTTYPYGSKFEKGVCNVSRPHLLSRWFGSNPRAWKYEEHFNNPKLNQLEGWLANTGAFAGCTSDYGVSDMVGNLHEWVADEASAEAVRALPLRPEIRRALLPHRSGRGMFMGGFYSTGSEHGDGCTFVTMAHEPAYHDYSTGFRCCKDL